ncbi:peptide-methionine (S)-S-oxide reductase [Kangiella sp. HD9-110m-PIT-SAG07]|nr:peptide-methionine (S)-S-oxide reductase [Kangiella sp. HD9-110m-PIT-SAG07]
MAYILTGGPNKASSPQLVTQKADVKSDIPATKHLDSIVLGAGCFWGAEKRYAAIPGVVDAVSGYADGEGIKPEYSEIIKSKHRLDPNNYAEVVKVTFNRNQVSLEAILKNYFEGHDPTQVNRQGNDIGTQYRSTILTNSSEQQDIVQSVTAEFQVLLSQADYGQIATIVKPLNEFHPAEEYHQDYLVKNPNGYCPDHSTGVVFDEKDKVPEVDNTALQQGKQIVVIEPRSYCPYCEKFKKNVTNDYQGTVPLTWRFGSQLDGLEVTTETWATPTVLFLENGKEVFGHQGYLTPEEFYAVLGKFKLGDTEAYDVAFQQGTDSRFCKEYDIFKDTPPGVFIDKLSGQPLFDTKDRFQSKTGWLSFTQPVKDAVTYHEDNAFGLERTEIRSKSTGIHLGHVFDDGPNGQPRYCINATVLEFVPRSES